MRKRVTDPNHDSYKYYGGRGITIDPRWDDYRAFLADMGPRPTRRHTIERLDNAGNYKPGNCVWALPIQQRANRRDNRDRTAHKDA